jgi:hypothetical protein
MIWGILKVEKGAFTREKKLAAIYFFAQKSLGNCPIRVFVVFPVPAVFACVMDALYFFSWSADSDHMVGGLAE